MNPKYSKLQNITRPQYPDLPPMSIEDRAAQFSPFAAVVGYDDAVEETARFTDSMIELSEDEVVLLNGALDRALELIDLSIQWAQTGEARRAHPGALHELCRLREVVCDCYYGENAYLSNDNDMLRYFDAFALMLRN